MNEIEKALQGKRCFRAMGAVSQPKIDEAEEELSIRFADDYRQYLLAFGEVSYYGHELTGVCPYPRLSVVNVTNELRELFPDVPSDWYVIEETNIDGIVIWQSSDGAVYQAVPNMQPSKIAESLLDYIG